VKIGVACWVSRNQSRAVARAPFAEIEQRHGEFQLVRSGLPQALQRCGPGRWPGSFLDDPASFCAGPYGETVWNFAGSYRVVDERR
jgi:hypothetical protein